MSTESMAKPSAGDSWAACNAYLRMLARGLDLRNEWQALQQRRIDRDSDTIRRLQAGLEGAHDWRAFGDAWQQSLSTYAQASLGIWLDTAVWSTRVQHECMNALVDWLREYQAAGLKGWGRLAGAGARNMPWQNWMTELERATFESVRPDGGMGKTGSNRSGAAAN
ncbi:hypothetical protein WT81_30220 [Burkholderia stagnalis]|uniref:hypothetical protein n=1 Tax=Burkholderia stagnalis TaxID=1503054 RepID=UPI00075FC32C|nr:hypothetical protein [Burkholderia stagnalis]KWK49230.1 hypothetical protein WT81_30220 [Burkholderia stagnalis]KWK57362.1 hypothetical protein WT80_30385 [Burkholderia stagnalis]